MPGLSSVVPFQVLRHAGNFAITWPTREVLFTVLPQEDRYKTKSFIDTVVYRLGDQTGAWSYAGLAALGWTLHDIALAAILVCLLWMCNAMWLGWREIRMAADQAAAAETARAGAPT